VWFLQLNATQRILIADHSTSGVYFKLS
jgi:hypothetical protein